MDMTYCHIAEHDGYFGIVGIGADTDTSGGRMHELERRFFILEYGAYAIILFSKEN